MCLGGADQFFGKTKEPAVKAVNGCQYRLPIETVRSRNAKERGKYPHSFRMLYSKHGQASFFLRIPATVKCRARPTIPFTRGSLHAYSARRSRRRWRFCSRKRVAASNSLLCSFNHLSVIKINPNNWVRWRWIASNNNNNTVVIQIAPFGRMASFVTEDNLCR